MKNYKFSIVTAAINSNTTIEKTFKSIKRQNYLNYENIVVDSSNTRSLYEKFKSRFNFKYIFKKLSLYEALNLGIKQSKGEIIFFLHSNDIFYDENVLKSVNFFFNKNNCDACFGNIKIISKKNFLRDWNFKSFDKKKTIFWRIPASHWIIYKKKNL